MVSVPYGHLFTYIITNTIFLIYTVHLTNISNKYLLFITVAKPQDLKKKESEDSYISTSPLSNMSERKKQRIFDTITQEIGSFWRDLARNLQIREWVIDEIDFQNQTLHVKATKLLKEYDSKADPQRWFFILCEALEKSRRKDLVRSIQNIMAMNI